MARMSQEQRSNGNGGARTRVVPDVDLVGLAALVGVLMLATAAGLVMRARSGRVHGGGRHGGMADQGRARQGEVPTGGEPEDGGGGWALAARTPTADERVLLLQLSSPVCAPCRQTAAVLDDLASRTPGIVHSEIDVAERPEVARELHVLRTPTVVAFDRSGAELLRVSGVPRVTELASALAPALVTWAGTGNDAPASPDTRLPSSP